MNMESIRIYVPENRVQERAVEQAMDQVIAGGATLYYATGYWPSSTGTISERVVVVEVLDCEHSKQRAVEDLVAELLAAGEEVVLVAMQPMVIHLLMRRDHPAMVGQLSQINGYRGIYPVLESSRPTTSKSATYRRDRDDQEDR
jgi:hypothetical protein